MKIYKKYLIKEFVYTALKVSFVFCVLGFVMGILEELNFFSEFDVKYYFPIILVLLNLPSIIYEIFPFIFLISSQLIFLNLLEKGELNTFKNHGLTNFKLIKLIASISFLSGIFIVTLFYNFSASLQFKYLDIKKNFTNDNKYLATITENGLWIKDEKDEVVNFINAKNFTLNSLENVDIIQLDKNFNFIKNIKAEKAFIKDNKWILSNTKTIDNNNSVFEKDKIDFHSNFNYKDISGLFSNLTSLTLWKLIELKKDYLSIKYSTTEIDYHFQKVMAYPFLITIISVLSATLMLNIGHQKQKLYLIVLGIMLSVVIYYINFFFGTMGINEKIPLFISVWTPILILLIISVIGLVRINEK